MTIKIPASVMEARIGDPAALTAAIDAMLYNEDGSEKAGPGSRRTTLETVTGRWTVEAILEETGVLYGAVQRRWDLSVYPAGMVGG